MKLVALANLRVPEGAFAAGQSFETSDDIAARVIAGGYARPDEIIHRDPSSVAAVSPPPADTILHRDPVAAVSPPPSTPINRDPAPRRRKK